MPDTLRFLLIIACLAGAVYGAAWGLANYPPEQTEIVRALPHEKIRVQCLVCGDLHQFWTSI